MTNAGWYPDPAGAPDTYRYWDGQSWSQMTTSQPPSAGQQPAPQQPTVQPPAPQQPHQGGYGVVPSSPTPTPDPDPGYGGYGGQGGYGQQQWSPQPTGGGNGKTIGIVIAAVLVLALLGVGGFFGVRALNDDGDGKADDDPSRSGSTDDTGGTDPTEGTSSTVRPSGIQCTGGTGDPEEDPSPDIKELEGGGLTIPRREGYTIATGGDVAFSFPDAFVLQYTDVEEKWISLTGVGGLARANGFDSVDTAAEVVVQCLTSSDLVYSGFTGRTDLKNESIDIDGKPAHRITTEIRVEDPRITVDGDVLDVIVVDTGDPESFGVYIAMAAIGNDDLISKNEDTMASLSVD